MAALPFVPLVSSASPGPSQSLSLNFSLPFISGDSFLTAWWRPGVVTLSPLPTATFSIPCSGHRYTQVHTLPPQACHTQGCLGAAIPRGEGGCGENWGYLDNKSQQHKYTSIKLLLTLHNIHPFTTRANPSHHLSITNSVSFSRSHLDQTTNPHFPFWWSTHASLKSNLIFG